MDVLSCPYCGAEAVPATGVEIYPHRPDLASKTFWRCPVCLDAYVGCHAGTDKPLGRLANAALRQAKIAAHEAFDKIWKTGRIPRHQAYQWLAEQLGLTRELCHIGMFDEARCADVARVARELFADPGAAAAAVRVLLGDRATTHAWEPADAGWRCARCPAKTPELHEVPACLANDLRRVV